MISSQNIGYHKNMRIGDKISFFFGLGHALKHVGVCAGFHPVSGEPLVAHNSQRFGGVRMSPISEFSEGRKVKVYPQSTPRSPETIQQRIRELLGKPYNVLSFNCEHFVSEVQQGRARSPQLALWFGAVLIGGAVALVLSSRR